MDYPSPTEKIEVPKTISLVGKKVTLTPLIELDANKEYFIDISDNIKPLDVNSGSEFPKTIELKTSQKGMYIEYLQDLDYIRNALDETFILTRDLDFNDDNSYDKTDTNWQAKKTAWTNRSGFGWNPIAQTGGSSNTYFSGIFRGNGHTIKNFFCKQPYYGNGLFVINEGEISNLNIENAYVVVEGEGGILCSFNNGTIYQCEVNGDIVINDLAESATDAGLIASKSLNGTIIEYSATDAGLIASKSLNGTIIECSATGTISGGFINQGGILGGLVGRVSFDSNKNVIKNCFTKVDISSGMNIAEGITVNIGGLIGFLDYSDNIIDDLIINCYSVGVISCQYTENCLVGSLIGNVDTYSSMG